MTTRYAALVLSALFLASSAGAETFDARLVDGDKVSFRLKAPISIPIDNPNVLLNCPGANVFVAVPSARYDRHIPAEKQYKLTVQLTKYNYYDLTDIKLVNADTKSVLNSISLSLKKRGVTFSELKSALSNCKEIDVTSFEPSAYEKSVAVE